MKAGRKSRNAKEQSCSLTPLSVKNKINTMSNAGAHATVTNSERKTKKSLQQANVAECEKRRTPD